MYIGSVCKQGQTWWRASQKKAKYSSTTQICYRKRLCWNSEQEEIRSNAFQLWKLIQINILIWSIIREYASLNTSRSSELPQTNKMPLRHQAALTKDVFSPSTLNWLVLTVTLFSDCILQRLLPRSSGLHYTQYQKWCIVFICSKITEKRTLTGTRDPVLSLQVL